MQFVPYQAQPEGNLLYFHKGGRQQENLTLPAEVCIW